MLWDKRCAAYAVAGVGTLAIIAALLSFVLVEVQVQKQRPVAVDVPELQSALIHNPTLEEVSAIIEDDPQSVNHDCRITGTPLQLAIVMHELEIAEMLVNKGADADLVRRRFASRNDIERLRLLQELLHGIDERASRAHLQ